MTPSEYFKTFVHGHETAVASIGMVLRQLRAENSRLKREKARLRRRVATLEKQLQRRRRSRGGKPAPRGKSP